MVTSLQKMFFLLLALITDLLFFSKTCKLVCHNLLPFLLSVLHTTELHLRAIKSSPLKILPVASIGLGRKIYQKSAIQATFEPILHITRIRQKTAVKLYAVTEKF